MTANSESADISGSTTALPDTDDEALEAEIESVQLDSVTIARQSTDPLKSYGSVFGFEQRRSESMRFQYGVLKSGDPAYRELGDALWLTAERSLAGASTLEVQDALFSHLIEDLKARGASSIQAAEIGHGGHTSVLKSLLKQGASVAAVENRAFERMNPRSFAAADRQRLACFRDLKFMLHCMIHGPRYQLAVLNMPTDQRQIELVRMAVATGGYLVLQSELVLDFLMPLDTDLDWVKIIHYPQNGQHGRMTLDSGAAPYALRATFCVYRRIAGQGRNPGVSARGLKNAYRGKWMLRMDPHHAILMDFDSGAVNVARFPSADRNEYRLIGSIDTNSGELRMIADESAKDVSLLLKTWLEKE